MSDGPRLLAMTRTGDVVFVEDGSGLIWLYEALNDDGPKLVTTAEVDDAVHRHQLTRVDRSFVSWADLDRFRLEQASEFLRRFSPPRHDLAADDVCRGLLQIERWLAKGERGGARQLALHLLSVEVVRLDEALHRQVVDAVDRASAPSEAGSLSQRATRSALAVRGAKRVKNQWEWESAA